MMVEKLKLNLTVLIILCAVILSNVAIATVHSYSKAVKRAAPAVVSIKITRLVKVKVKGKYVTKRKVRNGSGVIVSRGGYILTNTHVVRNAHGKLSVILADRRIMPAKIIGSDKDTDLAVLKISPIHIKAIQIGDSDRLRVGDVVLAIGNPFGLGQSVTQGIISALGQNKLGASQLDTYIQTDAAINPGNSGGALINTSGELIGINTGIYSKTGGYQGVSFAIPSNSAVRVLKQLLKYGSVQRGWLGLKVATISVGIAAQFKLPVKQGVLVVSMTNYGKKLLAGKLQLKDVIVSINGKQIRSNRGFINTVSTLLPGTQAKLIFYRNNKKYFANVKVGKRRSDRSLYKRG